MLQGQRSTPPKNVSALHTLPDSHRPPCHVVKGTKLLSPPGPWDLFLSRPPQGKASALSHSHPIEGRYMCLSQSENDSPRLIGSWPAVLATTIPCNKSHLLYILPCVWKSSSNPCPDRESPIIHWVGAKVPRCHVRGVTE